MTNVKTQLGQMEEVLSHNLKQACEEIDLWHKTGILASDSIIKAGASMLTDDVFGPHRLVMAENCVNRLAIQYVISHYKQ